MSDNRNTWDTVLGNLPDNAVGAIDADDTDVWIDVDGLEASKKSN